MTISEYEQVARIIAVGCGIFFGSAAISSVCWVWVRRQIFAYGGSALSLAGIILIGASIWKTVDVKAEATGLQLKLAEIEQKLIKSQAHFANLIIYGNNSIYSNLDGAPRDGLAGEIARTQAAAESDSNLTNNQITKNADHSDKYRLYARLGALYLLSGEIQKSETSYNQALILYRRHDQGNSKELSNILIGLGDAKAAAGQMDEARHLYQEGIAARSS